MEALNTKTRHATSAETGEVFSIGYARWSTADRWKKFVSALQAARVELLVDIRHSACASQLDKENTYGPRDWHVQAGGLGIAANLKRAGIGYLWLIELGNPQKQDPQMAVLREHLADKSGGWPVHRGLSELVRIVEDERLRCCLLCACADFNTCHRKPVVEALLERLPAGWRHKDLSS